MEKENIEASQDNTAHIKQTSKDIFAIAKESLSKPMQINPSKRKAHEDLNVNHRIRKSKIEWTEYTWNPMIGCSHATVECWKCYAKELAEDMLEQGIKKYANGFQPTFLPNMLQEPKNLPEPSIIFVNSMSDLLHEAFAIEQIKGVLQVIHEEPRHVFIALTKRHKRLEELDREIVWPNNLIMGVSIGVNDWVQRADYLRRCGAKHKVISAEPLLEMLPDLDLTGIDWCITGGESGPGARPFDPQWAEDIRQMCLKTGTAFFHKQHGGVQKHRTGRKLFGKIYSDYPPVILNMRGRRTIN